MTEQGVGIAVLAVLLLFICLLVFVGGEDVD
jgi:hypothetical protein